MNNMNFSKGTTRKDDISFNKSVLKVKSFWIEIKLNTFPLFKLVKNVYSREQTARWTGVKLFKAMKQRSLQEYPLKVK